MTPKMEDALLTAYTAGDEGLHWTVAGWAGPNDRVGDPYHSPVVVSRLVYDRGFLDAVGPKSGPRQRRIINAAGVAYVEKHLKKDATR